MARIDCSKSVHDGISCEYRLAKSWRVFNDCVEHVDDGTSSREWLLQITYAPLPFFSDGSESDSFVWLKWSDCYDGKLCDVYSTVCRSKCACVVVRDVVLSLLLSCTQLRGVCPCLFHENWFSSLSMQFSVPWIYVCRRGWRKKTFVPVRTIITRDRVVSVAKLIMSHNYILWHCDIFPRGLYQQRICH